MKQNHPSLLPNGLLDLLPPQAENEARTIDLFMQSFAAFGYRRVKPPLVEFEESLLGAGPGQSLAPQTFRMMDPVSGRMMGVRADVTAQIARIATSRLGDEPRPLRLSYAADVLRVNGTQLRPERQFCQVGCEMIGVDSVVSDGSPCYPAPCIYKIEDPPHITGCYRLALVDTVGNMTPFSEETCFDVEDCMFYELPNVFTPNNDGINDLLTPFPYSNVEEIELYIYNRWGRKVFYTQDPDINWDGRDYLSGEPVSNGTFYYSCTIYVQTLYGMKEKKLHGTVTLIRD